MQVRCITIRVRLAREVWYTPTFGFSQGEGPLHLSRQQFRIARPLAHVLNGPCTFEVKSRKVLGQPHCEPDVI